MEPNKNRYNFFLLRRRLYFLCLFLFILLSVSLYLRNNYLINTTSSLPKGIYQINFYKGEKLSKGEIIAFPIPDKLKKIIYERGWESRKVKFLLKEVGATSSDTVKVKKNDLYINHVLFGKIKIEDQQGKVIPRVNPSQLQPKENEILPLTPNPFSFDGRYFGTISMEDIKYTAQKTNFLEIIMDYFLHFFDK